MQHAETAPSCSARPCSPLRLVLSQRNFRLLWCGQLFSALGGQAFPVALAALVIGRGGTAAELSGVLAAETVALVLGILAASMLADRFRRTRLMFAADLLRFVAVSILAVRLDLPAVGIGCAAALLGLGQGLFQPPYAALMPRIVRSDLLQPANSLNAMVQYGAQIGGPALGGVLAGFYGVRTVLAVNAATYVLSLVSLLSIREAVADRPVDRRGSGRRGAAHRALDDFRGGFRAVRARPWIAATIAMVTIAMTVGVAPSLVLLPVEANARFGGEKAYSMVLAAIGVGAVVGALGASRVRTRKPGIPAAVARGLNGGAMLGLAFFSLPGVIVTWALAGAGVAFAEVLYLTAVQRDLPDSVLARVMALDWLGGSGLMPLGYAMTGVLAGIAGPRNLLLCAGLLVLLITPLPLLVRGGATMSSVPGPLGPATVLGKE